MILIRFFKQQSWKYAVPCILFLLLFLDISIPWTNFFIGKYYEAWHLLFATAFLICYSLKFAEKYNNLVIDRLKLFFYFLFFTAFLLAPGRSFRSLVVECFPWFVFYLYFYSILVLHQQEMQAQGKTTKRSSWLIITIVQSVLILSIAVWAITQKVEAEKQKEQAVAAQIDAEKAKDYVLRARQSEQKSNEYALQLQLLAQDYRALLLKEIEIRDHLNNDPKKNNQLANEFEEIENKRRRIRSDK
ncbi:MAG TPA: hypothetical protein VNB90_06705 [Cytophagaceae bacterium]|nr:hypothetical protein [Cytophagaceae bacterium]